MKNTLENLWNFFFPAECFNCGIEDFFLCPQCAAKIPISLQQSPTDFLEKLIVLADYQKPIVQKTIETLKFQHGRGVAGDIQPFLRKFHGKISLPKTAIFVPVPLHFFRKNTRGYNQSLLLAREFSKLFENPVYEILRRRRWTIPQSHLNKADRETNLIEAFSVLAEAKKIPKDTPLFLIDDVGTTLSTLHECAKALEKEGYKSISAIVLARSQS